MRFRYCNGRKGTGDFELFLFVSIILSLPKFQLKKNRRTFTLNDKNGQGVPLIREVYKAPHYLSSLPIPISLNENRKDKSQSKKKKTKYDDRVGAVKWCNVPVSAVIIINTTTIATNI